MPTELAKLSDRLGDIRNALEYRQRMGTDLDLGVIREYQRILMQAKAIIDRELGMLNDFGAPLLMLTSSAKVPRPMDVANAQGLLDAADVQIMTKAPRPTVVPSQGAAHLKAPYVAHSRLQELRNLPCTKWDTMRLVRLLEELNIAHQNELYMATVVLVRTIANHVPPIFGFATFEQVASNYSAGTPSGKSFKGSMQHLQNSMKHIADAYLHVPIRKSEVLPSAQQVDFSRDLDVLLAEAVRVLKF